MLQRILALICFSSLSRMVWAADVPKPSEWLDSVTAKTWSSRSNLMRNIMVVSKDPARQEIWEKTLATFSELTWFQYLDQNSAAYVRKLNPNSKTEWETEDLVKDYLPVHLLLEDKGSQLGVSLFSGESLSDAAQWPITDNKRKSSAAFVDYLNSKLGYEALVIDTKDEFILAGLLVPVKNLGQGILIKGSSTQLTINSSLAEGEALLQMVEQEGSLAVLEILSQKGGDSSKIAPGSKIILGQNRNLDRVIKKYNAVAPGKKP